MEEAFTNSFDKPLNTSLFIDSVSLFQGILTNLLNETAERLSLNAIIIICKKLEHQREQP